MIQNLKKESYSCSKSQEQHPGRNPLGTTRCIVGVGTGGLGSVTLVGLEATCRGGQLKESEG
jgi:hypothetical protein